MQRIQRVVDLVRQATDRRPLLPERSRDVRKPVQGTPNVERLTAFQDAGK